LNHKWTLVRVLGVGGASAVYEAVHRNGRHAALKLMISRATRHGSTQELAAHEAWVANAVKHPGVVEVLDDDVAEDGSPYLVMELLRGETLEQRRVRAGGRLPLTAVLPIVEQLLATLGTAHERGIVHRDLKPDNVFVTQKGRVKVLDFGLAAAGRSERAACPWFGTPGFMPPEQARMEWPEVDARSDLWAVAATIYTALTGRLVHPMRTPAELVVAAASEDVDIEPLAEVAPRRFVDVLERALARDKEDRWPDARAMLDALRSAAHDPAPPRTRAPPTVPPVPHCHSTTRVFLLQGGAVSPGCRARGARAACGLICTMCPECPDAVITRRVL
jgi:serine/threonine-protein kinase